MTGQGGRSARSRGLHSRPGLPVEEVGPVAWDQKSELGAGRAVAVAAPIERLPTFLREGGILPTQEAVQLVGQAAAGVLSLDFFGGEEPGRFGFRAAPLEVTLDGRRLAPSNGEDVEGWAYDAPSRAAMVRVREKGARLEVRVTLTPRH